MVREGRKEKYTEREREREKEGEEDRGSIVIFLQVILFILFFTERLRKHLLDKGGASAIYEGLRRFIGLQDPAYENCLQYGCRALLSLIMSPG